MTEEESLAEAHRILSEAGWRGIAKTPWNGLCAVPGLVGGHAPNGDQYAKAYTAFPQAMASAMGLDPADYPDEAHEAAAWLVKHVQGRVAPSAPVSTLDPVAEAEQSCVEGEAVASQPITINVQGATVNIGDIAARSDGTAGMPGPVIIESTPAAAEEAAPYVHPESEAIGEAEPAPASAVDSGASAAAEGDEGSAADGGDGGGQGVLAPYGPDGEGDSDEGEEDILDAEFAESEIERALLEDDYVPPDDPVPEVEGGDAEFPALEEAIRDLAPDEIEPEPEPEAGVAYFGDDLDTMRRIKAGDVAMYAAELIEQVRAGLEEGPNEFADVQSYVVTNLDKATGAFVGTNQATYERFILLSDGRRVIADIERHRDLLTELLMTREREWVEACDPYGGWP